MPEVENKDWKIFHNTRSPREVTDDEWPPSPPWRKFIDRLSKDVQIQIVDETFSNRDLERATTFKANERTVDMVNAAFYLRRPLLVTGKPGMGKSSLIFAVAHELKLGKVLKWSITSRSTLQSALYQYDAIGRLQDSKLQAGRLSESKSRKTRTPDIGNYLRLGPLGTALLPSKRPRALLIDEIDKSDIDLPNDLLNIFEEGEYEIPELARLGDDTTHIRLCDSRHTYPIVKGRVQCTEFPFVVMTSNGEREFPPAFLRRCLQLEIQEPSEIKLKEIVTEHLGKEKAEEAAGLLRKYIKERGTGTVATDQLLNAVFMVIGNERILDPKKRDELAEILMKSLSS